jgi:hypothetical protein
VRGTNKTGNMLLKPPNFIPLVLVALLHAADPARGATINLKDAPFSAAGDGVADDRAALARALSAAKAGDTLLVPPGNYRIVLTNERLRVPPGVTLLGHGGRSRFLLFSSGKDDEDREFLHVASGVTLEGLTIERAAGFRTVLLPIFGDAGDVTLRNCTIVGNCTKLRGGYCHAIQLGVGTLKNLTFDRTEIRDCTYGLFQANNATGVVDGVTVERCTFERNEASDLEFNAPQGTMRNVVVRDCTFRDNLCKSGSAGFAVGFANVQNGRVENCDIRRYGSEALHVEDRSADIRLTGNTIVAGSTVQPNGVILIIRDSRNVVVDRNVIDARPNTNNPHLVLVTAGGTALTTPSDVSVTNNILVNGRATRTWYLQPGSGPAASGNVILPGNEGNDK